MYGLVYKDWFTPFDRFLYTFSQSPLSIFHLNINLCQCLCVCEPQIVYILQSNLCVRVRAPMSACLGAWVSVWLRACVCVHLNRYECMLSHTHPRLFPMTSTSGGQSIPRWQSSGSRLHQHALRIFRGKSGSLLFTKSMLFIKSFTSFSGANGSRHLRITLAIHTSKGFDFPLPFRCVQQY